MRRMTPAAKEVAAKMSVDLHDPAQEERFVTAMNKRDVAGVTLVEIWSEVSRMMASKESWRDEGEGRSKTQRAAWMHGDLQATCILQHHLHLAALPFQLVFGMSFRPTPCFS